MVNGFFLGGAAEGIASSNKQDLAERTLAQDTGLRTRALDIQEKTAERSAAMAGVEKTDKLIADTLTTVSQVISDAVAGGNDPNKVRATVAPLVESAKRLAAKTGRDPSAIDAKVGAWLAQPNAIDKAKVDGQAAAAKTLATDAALAAAAYNNETIRDPVKKVEVENKLRDDYEKRSQPFMTVRDYWGNFQQADDSGAGDITRVYAFMKMQDPGSAVLPGEYATAQNAAGVPSAIMSMYNKLIGGGLLEKGARKELQEQASKLYASRALQHDKTTTDFASLAKRKGLDPNNVIIDMKPVQAAAAPASPFDSRFGSGALPPLPPGFVPVGR